MMQSVNKTKNTFYLRISHFGKGLTFAVFLLLLFSQEIKAQSSLDIELEEVESLRVRAQLDSALLMANTLKDRYSDDLSQARIHIQIAKCRLDQNNFQLVDSLLTASEKSLEIPRDDLLLAEILNLRGELAYKNDDLEAAFQAYEQALGIRETYLGGRHEKVADSYNNLGIIAYLQGDYPQALLHHQQALTIREEILEAPNADLASSFNNLAACYFDMAYYQEAIQYNQRALDQRLNLFGKQHPGVANSYNNLGNCYFELNDLAQAISNHQEALTIRRALGDPLDLAESLNNLGTCHSEIGNYDAAIAAFDEALAFYRTIYSEPNLAVADVLSNLGNALVALGDYPTAANQLVQAQLIVEQILGKNALGVIPILIGQGQAFNQLEEYERAQAAYQQAIQLLGTHFGGQHPLVATCYNNLGNTFYRQKDYAAAKKNFLFALNRFQATSFVDKKEIATCQLNLGSCEQALGNIDAAISWYQKAMTTFEDQVELPSLQLSIVSNWAKALRDSGKEKAALDLLAAYEQQIKEAKLPPLLELIDFQLALANAYASQSWERALASYEKAADIIDDLVIRYNNTFAKRKLRSEYYLVYERGIHAAYQLFQQDKKDAWLERAFLLAERSKALLIREALNEDRAQSFAGVPDSLFQKEQELLQTLNEYEQIRFEQAHLLDSLEKEALSIQILELESTHNQLVRRLERAYPKYYELKYQVAPVSIDEFQSALAEKGKTALSYFLGDSLAFVFVIEGAGLSMHPIQRNVLDKNIFQLWDGISNFTGAQAAEDYEIYANIFAANASAIYQDIFAPVADQLGENIVVIPDGVLCYLPFDLLVKQTPDSNRLFRFQQYDFLIKHYQFSYAYSASLWTNNTMDKQLEKAKWTFGGFAPEFSETNAGLEPLIYNIPEVKTLGKLLPKDFLLTGRAASLDAFKRHAPQCKIIHLATHGMANALESDFAYLAFTTQDSVASLLYTKYIYDLSLSAVDMVVLSACETGLGEAQPGEGVISLAHAFTYAGARSIINTLWSIDDEKTSEIMIHFYQYLKKGFPKDKALRQAKLDYLNTYTGENAHPFFWAAFMPVGDMDEIAFGKPFPWYWGFLLVPLIVFYWYRKRKATSAS